MRVATRCLILKAEGERVLYSKDWHLWMPQRRRTNLGSFDMASYMLGSFPHSSVLSLNTTTNRFWNVKKSIPEKIIWGLCYKTASAIQGTKRFLPFFYIWLFTIIIFFKIKGWGALDSGHCYLFGYYPFDPKVHTWTDGQPKGLHNPSSLVSRGQCASFLSEG